MKVPLKFDSIKALHILATVVARFSDNFIIDGALFGSLVACRNDDCKLFEIILISTRAVATFVCASLFNWKLAKRFSKACVAFWSILSGRHGHFYSTGWIEDCKD